MSKTVIFGERQIADYFENSIVIDENCNLSKPVASHPDMNLFVIDKTVFLPENSPLKHLFKTKNFCITEVEKTLQKNYPFDVLFNAKSVGNTVILNKKTVAKEILQYAENNNKQIINVPQGYASCCVLSLNENAFITADKGIEKALTLSKKKVLKIQEGFINIDTYDYGFIGGASGFVNGTLYFFGDITAHSDYNKIDLFLKQNKIKYKYFSFPLKDIGGCIEI